MKIRLLAFVGFAMVLLNGSILAIGMDQSHRSVAPVTITAHDTQMQMKKDEVELLKANIIELRATMDQLNLELGVPQYQTLASR